MSQPQIDWTRCDGHGLCIEVFPAAIMSDEWGIPNDPVAKTSAQHLRDAQRAGLDEQLGQESGGVCGQGGVELVVLVRGDDCAASGGKPFA